MFNRVNYTPSIYMIQLNSFSLFHFQWQMINQFRLMMMIGARARNRERKRDES